MPPIEETQDNYGNAKLTVDLLTEDQKLALTQYMRATAPELSPLKTTIRELDAIDY